MTCTQISIINLHMKGLEENIASYKSTTELQLHLDRGCKSKGKCYYLLFFYEYKFSSYKAMNATWHKFMMPIVSSINPQW